MSFKHRFAYITQKYFKSLAVIENRELIELFVKILDNIFQDMLNSRLSIKRNLKVNTQKRSCIEDLYNLEHIIQKVVDLISDKTITRALKYTPVILLRNKKVNLNSRRLVYFTKEKVVKKVMVYPNMEVLQ